MIRRTALIMLLSGIVALSLAGEGKKCPGNEGKKGTASCTKKEKKACEKALKKCLKKCFQKIKRVLMYMNC